jgi:K+-transporting ATPase KdpF subunit
MRSYRKTEVELMGVAFLLLVVLLTTIYLFYALLRPEKF